MNRILKISVVLFFLQGATYALGASFVDALNRHIVLDSAPQRIVSLAPSITEVLYSLGLGDRVVGVTRFSYYPPQARNKPKVGSYVDLNVERIIALLPDIAIGTVDGNQPGSIKILEQAGIQVYLINPRRVSDVIETIGKIAELCGVPERGGRLVAQLRDRVRWIKEKTAFLPSPRVFMQINLRPIMSVNRNTFHNDIIRLAGGINITENEPFTYPKISMEEIISRDPQIIVISSMERRGAFEKAKKEWLKWPSISAVKYGRIYLIDSDLIDRPSPRLIKGLEQMARIIHPEVGW